MDLTWLGLAMVVYLGLLLALSLYGGLRIADAEDYVVAGRRLPLWLAWGTLLATWFGAATVLGAAEAARLEGVRGTLLDPFASGLALILAGVLIARPLWRMKLLSLADFYGRIYSPRTEMLAAWVMVPGYFGWIGAQFLALGGVLQTAFALEPAWQPTLVVAGACVILVYTLIGGMWSVTLTDTVQMVLVIIGLIALGVATLDLLGDGDLRGGLDRLVGETDPDSLRLLPEAGLAAGLAWIGTLASGSLGNLPGQDLTQRIFASRSEATAARACWLSGLAYLGFGLIPVGLGLASRILLPDDFDGEVVGALAARLLSGPGQILFLVALLSILVSTATSSVLAPATIVSQNLLTRLPYFNSRRLLAARTAVVLMVGCGILAAFSGSSILELLENALSITLVSLFVPLMMGLYGKPRHAGSAWLAILAGTAVWAARELLEGLILPMPDDLANPPATYVQWLQTTPMVQQLLAPLRVLFVGFASVPSALSGTLASLIGYYVGQLCFRKSVRC